ncbi:MAG TPA: DinB family protein [Pyrinomonadaceae bacterium]|nr:DinB family protein [Pyrinomonadaceae bacterium]
MSSVQNSPDEIAVADAFVGHARNFLVHHYLPKIERCLEKLSDDQIWWRPNLESNSIGNLVLHLCGNARQWIISGVGGRPDTRHRDQEFQQQTIVPRQELVTLLRSTLLEVDQVLTNLDHSSLLSLRCIQGLDVKVLEAIFHVTEHFSMHTGQIILLTKMLTKSDLAFYDFSTGAPVHGWE